MTSSLVSRKLRLVLTTADLFSFNTFISISVPLFIIRGNLTLFILALLSTEEAGGMAIPKN